MPALKGTATKVSDTKIEVTTQADAPAPIVQSYDYDFLVSQKAQIIKQANDYLAQRQKELDDVQALLDQCDALGVGAAVMPSPLGEDVQPIGGDIKQ
jgi:hypothetical protein